MCEVLGARNLAVGGRSPGAMSTSGRALSRASGTTRDVVSVRVLVGETAISLVKTTGMLAGSRERYAGGIQGKTVTRSRIQRARPNVQTQQRPHKLSARHPGVYAGKPDLPSSGR